MTKHNLLFDSRGCPTSIKAILATSLRSIKLVQYSAVATNVEMWLYHCFSNDGGINRVVIQPYLDLIMTWLSGQAVSEAQTLILQFIKRYHVVPELFYQLLTDLVQTQQLQPELSLVLQGCWQNIVLTKSADFPCGLFHHRVRTAVTDSVVEYCVARHRFSGEPDDEDTWLTRLIRHGHLTEAQIDRVRQEFVGNANILRAIAQNHTRVLLQPLLDNYYLP